MWKYMDKEHTKEFILSLNLVQGNISDSMLSVIILKNIIIKRLF